MPTNSTPHKKPGTKPKPINLEQLAVLAGMQCTYEEIAAVFGLKKRQFIERINADSALREVIEDGWANGRASIRREQFKLLQAGNSTMAVWLGKQYLGQRDNLDSQLSGPAGGPIELKDASPRERLADRIARIAERSRAS